EVVRTVAAEPFVARPDGLHLAVDRDHRLPVAEAEGGISHRVGGRLVVHHRSGDDIALTDLVKHIRALVQVDVWTERLPAIDAGVNVTGHDGARGIIASVVRGRHQRTG